MPMPLHDAMNASKLNPEKTEAALQTVNIYCVSSSEIRYVLKVLFVEYFF